MNKRIKKYIGTKEFYAHLMVIALPIMLQNGISNFVNLLDNIMVGRLGTEQLSGVSIVNDLLFVFFLCLFGAISGAGIFTAQFFGQGNIKSVRDTFRIKVLICGAILIASVILFLLRGNQLISFYLHDGSDVGDLEATLQYGRSYLLVMLIGLFPLAAEMSFSSTLRECGETVVPMKASIVAVCINVVFNYLLIYGKLGLPALGVVGAALATVLSRYIQASIVIVWTIRHKEKVPYFIGAFESLKVPGGLVKKALITGFPLLMNESFWALGIVVQKAAYSQRGLAVVAAMNINSTVANMFNIVLIALGESVAIIIGQLLGAGKFDEAKQSSLRIIVFSAASCIVLGIILGLTSNLYPMIYNTTDEVRQLARKFLLVTAVMLPANAILNSVYFTIRAGGKTVITFIFDSGFLWCIMVPASFLLVYLTPLSIQWIFLLCESLNFLKILVGVYFMKKGSWVNSIVS